MENSGERKNIDNEFVIFFTEMNENESWLLDENIESFSDYPAATKDLKSDAGFVASNKMKSINGYIYGNLPGLSMCQGDTVSWHIIGMGTWSDVHNRKCVVLSILLQTELDSTQSHYHHKQVRGETITI